MDKELLKQTLIEMFQDGTIAIDFHFYDNELELKIRIRGQEVLSENVSLDHYHYTGNE